MTSAQVHTERLPVEEAMPSAGPGAMPRVLGVLAGAMVATMLDLGGRTGLTRALAVGPADAGDLAERTGGDERIAAEWLRCLTAAGLVIDHGARSIWAPDVMAMLDPPPGLPDVSAGVELFASLAGCVERVSTAFHAGGAVPADTYPTELASAMQRMSAGWTAHLLPDVWIPTVPGLADRLTAGGSIAEIGCGSGQALEALGLRFPAAAAVGFELDGRQVAEGQSRLTERGLHGRVQLKTQDATEGLTGAYDLVLALSVLHDVVNLDRMLSVIRTALAPRGCLMVVESPPVTGPGAAMLLATSTLYCVPTTAARGAGHPLGTLGLPPEVLVPAALTAGLSIGGSLPAPAALVSASWFECVPPDSQGRDGSGR